MISALPAIQSAQAGLTAIGVRSFFPSHGKEAAPMIAASRAHLEAAHETYFEHMRFAATVGAMASAAGLACLIHALVPALCTRTCSLTIGRLRTLFDDRGTLPTVTAQTSGAITFVGLAIFAAIIAAVQLAYSPNLIGVPLALLTLGIPTAFLLSNPELDALAD